MRADGLQEGQHPANLENSNETHAIPRAQAAPCRVLFAASLGFAGASLAQYPQDPSRVTISLPPPGAVTPPLANDPIGAHVDKTAPAVAGKSATGSESSQPIAKEAMSDTPIIPSKAELPDAAFRKLDAGRKGYVGREDVKGLSGFEKSFELGDVNKDSKLSPAEFSKAWADYTGRRNG
jgi:hypothetical protein